MRRGFGLIQVIFFIMILSSILTVTMKYATISSKQTGDLFAIEQAELFMQSAIELTLLGMSDHNKNTGCLHEVKILSQNKRFIADINISRYFLLNSEICDRKTPIITEESNGMVLMDIIVETNNTHPKNNQKVRITKRTLQRL